MPTDTDRPKVAVAIICQFMRQFGIDFDMLENDDTGLSLSLSCGLAC